MVVCDHYAQAEAISNRMSAARSTCRILVELNLGLNRTGIRPGSDARELVRGLLTLPGLQITGVMGDLGACRSNERGHAERLASRLEILQELREAMIATGIQEPIFTTFSEDVFPELCHATGIDEIQVDPFALTVRADGVIPEGDAAMPVFKVIATVLSRPKLERAVLNVGHRACGSHRFYRILRTAAGRELPEVIVEEIGPETTTLALGPTSRDLIIGETVEVWLEQPSISACERRPVFGMRHGIVEWIFPHVGD
jgi:D-serine deaminase-like pyridoxal phosphate-dependent protein